MLTAGHMLDHCLSHGFEFRCLSMLELCVSSSSSLVRNREPKRPPHPFSLLFGCFSALGYCIRWTWLLDKALSRRKRKKTREGPLQLRWYFGWFWSVLSFLFSLKELAGHLLCCFCFSVFDIYTWYKGMVFQFFPFCMKRTMAVSEIRERVGVSNKFCYRFGFQTFSFHGYMT